NSKKRLAPKYVAKPFKPVTSLNFKGNPSLTYAVVGRLFADLNIVYVRLSKASGCYLDKFGIAMPSRDIARTAITHRCAYTTCQLMNNGNHTAFIGHATLDPLGDELISAAAGFLEITISRSINHRTNTAHTAIRLIGTAFV